MACQGIINEDEGPVIRLWNFQRIIEDGKAAEPHDIKCLGTRLLSLGFSPDHGGDDQLHSLKVKVKKRRINVWHPETYVARKRDVVEESPLITTP